MTGSESVLDQNLYFQFQSASDCEAKAQTASQVGDAAYHLDAER
jgi:hypothetical protein